MLLQTRPDLTLIAIVGLIAVVLFLVKMAEDIHEGATSPSDSRRSFIETIIALFVTLFLLAFTLPSAITSLEEDDSETSILVIDEGETYTVEDGEDETWVAVYDNGTLNLNGSMNLEGGT